MACFARGETEKQIGHPSLSQTMC